MHEKSLISMTSAVTTNAESIKILSGIINKQGAQLAENIMEMTRLKSKILNLEDLVSRQSTYIN